MDSKYILVAIPTELIENAGIDLGDIVQIYATGTRIVIETPDIDDFEDIGFENLDRCCSMSLCYNCCVKRYRERENAREE